VGSCCQMCNRSGIITPPGPGETSIPLGFMSRMSATVLASFFITTYLQPKFPKYCVHVRACLLHVCVCTFKGIGKVILCLFTCLDIQRGVYATVLAFCEGARVINCMNVRLCVRACISTCACTHAYMYISMSTCLCAYAGLCFLYMLVQQVCMYVVCVCVQMSVCKCVCACVCLCVCANVCVCVCVCMCKCVCACVCVCAPECCVCVCACECFCVWVFLCVFVCLCVYVCVCMYMCACVCACVHPVTHVRSLNPTYLAKIVSEAIIVVNDHHRASLVQALSLTAGHLRRLLRCSSYKCAGRPPSSATD